MKKNNNQPFVKLDKNKGVWRNKVLIATPSTGLVRMEWVLARYGQIIPTNWSSTDLIQWMNHYVPSEYLLPDAENLIVKTVIEGGYEWLLSLEEDNVLPLDAFIRLNEYIKKADVPIVSGLYFTKSNYPEPILYRGRGNGSFQDFKLGDKVWVDGIPMGCTLIHASILKALWDESPEYKVGDYVTRRVFEIPDATTGNVDLGYGVMRGTTDLSFCTRVMENNIFEKAGWPEFQNKKYPFLVDTNLFVWHIDQQGRKFPLELPKKYLKEEKKCQKKKTTTQRFKKKA